MTVKTLCHCVLIERADGTRLGFTSFDCDLEIGGVTYYAHSAIDPSAVSQKADLSTDNVEIKALVDNNLITPQALIAGAYDNAKITLFLVDFIDFSTTNLLTGRVGNTIITDTGFTLELRSLAETISKPLIHKFSTICPYTFGDGKCTKDLAASGLLLTDIAVTTVVSKDQLVLNTTALIQEFAKGTLTFITGLNQGIPLEIRAIASSNTLTFYGTLPQVVQLGDKVTLKAYCHKTSADCRKYNNYINFGGFPTGGDWIPGLERLTVIS
jgi:uncharacterized phage protein (TIGR02218 family)